jgi:hypothetical protein
VRWVEKKWNLPPGIPITKALPPRMLFILKVDEPFSDGSDDSHHHQQQRTISFLCCAPDRMEYGAHQRNGPDSMIMVLHFFVFRPNVLCGIPNGDVPLAKYDIVVELPIDNFVVLNIVCGTTIQMIY